MNCAYSSWVTGKSADEEFADENAMHRPFVVFGVGRAHQKIAGGNAREVRQRRSLVAAQSASV